MKNKVKIFGYYIRSHLGAIAAWVLVIGSFLAVLGLFSIPLGAVAYGGAVSGFFLFVIGAIDFLKFYKKHMALEKSREDIIYSDEHMPEPAPGIEEDYDSIIRRLHRELSQTESRMNRAAAEMQDYYTLWAHQIKTPMAAMGLILQRDEIGSSEAAELSEELGLIEQYARMALCYVRLSSDSSDFVFKEYDVDNIVKQAVRRYSSQFIRRHLSISAPETGLRTVTDEKWLLFVIEQVISNAVKYTVKGGVEIYAEGATLCVKDSGQGVPPEDLPRIFEKGYTGCNGRLDKKASGIGLYLCREICKQLGHEITAENNEQGGLTVKIDLGRKELGVE